MDSEARAKHGAGKARHGAKISRSKHGKLQRKGASVNSKSKSKSKKKHHHKKKH